MQITETQDRRLERQFKELAQEANYTAMLQALRDAAKFIPTARARFPKSIRNHDRFQLELLCAQIGTCIARAEGRIA